jgi:hypothetical protein
MARWQEEQFRTLLAAERGPDALSFLVVLPSCRLAVSFMVDLSVISVTPEQFILDVVDPERIVVLNLDRRPDRWAAMQEAWDPEITRRFIRFPAVDGHLLPTSYLRANGASDGVPLKLCRGAIGCRESWLRAVGHYGPGLYFEDDARPCQLWQHGLPPDHAGVVLLGGGLTSKASEPGWEPVRMNVWGTHAFWVRTQAAADALVQAWRNPESLCQPADDTWTLPLQLARAVAAVPQIVFQVNLDSDILKNRQFGPNDLSLYHPWCSLKGRKPRYAGD